MEIKLLKEEYLKGPDIYSDFLHERVGNSEEHFDGNSVLIECTPDFPIYINVPDSERMPLFMQAFQAIGDYYLNIDREYHFEGQFWYSLLLLHKREFLMRSYPQISQEERHFQNIVLKKFDWENYIYKCILAAQYINDNVEDAEERKRYYELIVNNLDVFNYIIKYEIFRNDRFMLNVLDIIDENNLSDILKAKLKDRPDLGEDERIGRRVIYELNKSYPVVLAPTLEKEELKVLFMNHLKEYYKAEPKAATFVQQTDGKRTGLLRNIFRSGQ